VKTLNFYIVLLVLSVIAVSGCSSGGDEVSTGNVAPIAIAGADKNVVTGVVVVLDGSGSSDADGDVLTYAWTLQSKPARSSATLFSATLVDASFTPDVDGDYVISLVVNDGSVNSSADSVTFTASPTANNAPVANAGTDQSVSTGDTVILDGSGSFDLDGDTFTYAWTLQSQPAGSSSFLSTTTEFNPSFVADADGVYTISLVVNDGIDNSPADTVVVTASATPPVVGTFDAGKATYDGLDCKRCHAAGSYDTSTRSGGNDLYLKGDKVIIAIGTIPGMTGFSDLTEQQVSDLKVFLDSPLIAP